MTESDSAIIEQRKLALLDAAADLLVRKPGASLAEIAAHANISKATLHRYFSGREDLILALGHRAMETVEAVIQASHPDDDSALAALTRITEGMIPLANKVFFLLNEPILDTDAGFRSVEARVMTPIQRVIERGQAHGEFRGDLPADWLTHTLSFLLYATWYAIQSGELAPKHAPALLLTTVLHGMENKPT